MPLALARTLDDGAIQLVMATVGRYPLLDRLAAGAAESLAAVHVVLLGLLLVGGPGAARRRRRALGIRIAAALGLTIGAVGAVGRLVGRTRPFAHHEVAALVEHAPHRSFPSRHVACAATMATVALPTAPALGTLMGALGVALAISRVYAGLHYPSDVAAGWLLGATIGHAVRRGNPG
jgi:undecaprenyl-diphosphatase